MLLQDNSCWWQFTRCITSDMYTSEVDENSQANKHLDMDSSDSFDMEHSLRLLYVGMTNTRLRAESDLQDPGFAEQPMQLHARRSSPQDMSP